MSEYSFGTSPPRPPSSTHARPSSPSISFSHVAPSPPGSLTAAHAARSIMPFQEETSLSTRGQRLPRIIQSHSTANLASLRHSVSNRPQSVRRSTGRSASVKPETFRNVTFGEPSNNDDDDDEDTGLGLTQSASAGSGSISIQRRGTTGGAIDLGRYQRQPSRQPSNFPLPPSNFPLARGTGWEETVERDERRQSVATSVLFAPQMRSQRLIGNSNPRYRWQQYYKKPEELKSMKKPLREYYERNNYLIQQYMYIDKLLDSSLPRDLIEEYHDDEEHEAEQQKGLAQAAAGLAPLPLTEEDTLVTTSPKIMGQDAEGTTGPERSSDSSSATEVDGAAPRTIKFAPAPKKVKRTPHDLYKVPTKDLQAPSPNEDTPLLSDDQHERDLESSGASEYEVPLYRPDEETGSGDRVVTVAIYLNMAANTLLLALKVIVTVLTSSVSVLASLVDAALDFLSTAIVWVTTHIISRSDNSPEDKMHYPVGRRRLEPLGVLVFSVVMITSFVQVALQALQKLTGGAHTVVQLSPLSVGIMAATVVVKGICWLWCRMINNSSVQALAQDAMTDVIFNTFSIIFPLIGYYANLWWLDPLGGLLLSLYVIVAWSLTTRTHIANLTGRAASKDERNILLYLTMRFAHTIRHIQGLAAYHAGDKLNVEVDIVLDEEMSLRDSHDLGESLQYVLESVPGVERAFVHADYRKVNLPSHMQQTG